MIKKLSKVAVVGFAVGSTAVSMAQAKADAVASASPKLVNFMGTSTTASGAATEVSVSDQGGRTSSVLDHMYVNYFGIYHGASIKDMGSSYTVDANGKQNSNAINFDSEITAAYMFTDTIGAGPDIPFLLVPVLGQGVILGDLGVKAFNKRTISYKGFDLYTNIILQAPTSGGSQKRGETLGVKFTPYVRYSVPKSRFTLGAWTEEKAYLGVTYDKLIKLYAAPYVNYRLTSTLSLNLEYEFEAHHNIGDTGALNFSMYQSDIEPGLVWMVTPKVMFNPYLQVFTTKTVSADNMAVGAVISATVL